MSVIATGELQYGVTAATAVRHGLLLLTRKLDDFAGHEPALTVVGLSDQH